MIANDEFINLEVLAVAAPDIRPNGDVVHALYVGTPRSKFVDGDGAPSVMVFQCLPCTGSGNQRDPFRTPTALRDHFRNYHHIKAHVNVAWGKVAAEHVTGNEEGITIEKAVIDHPCSFCRGMMRAGSELRRAHIDGAIRDACVPCAPRLRAEVRAALVARPAPDAAV